MTTKIPVELSSTPGIVDNSDATAITIDSSERVGIGITSPTTALEVIGDIKIKEGSAYSNYGLIDVSEAVLTLETYSVNTSSYPANIIFKPAGTERMRIDSNGNVLIGSTTSIASNIGLQVTGTNAAGFISLFRDDSSIVADDDLGGILFYGDDNSATTQFASIRATAEGTHADGDNPTALRFLTTSDGAELSAERMRIDSGGGVAIGTTTPDGVSNLTVKSQNSTAGQEFVSLHHQASSGLIYFVSFMTGSGSDVGYITFNGTTGAFTAASDISLKENIRDLTGGLDFINQIKPRIFDWKEEGKGKDQVGFIAQEVEEIKPEWVGEKEGLKNIPVNLPHSIPYLIKAIQEQQTQIEALQSEINTLKGG